MKKKLTAFVLSLVIAAMPAAPVMNVQTVSAATTTKAAVQRNKWSKDHKYYYDNNGKKVRGIRKIGNYLYIFDSRYTLVTNKKYYKYGNVYYKIDTQGRAVKLSQVETLAAMRLQSCGGNLKKAFNWSASLRYNGNYRVAKKNQIYYGVYGFRTGSGDCYVMASTFYWMAKVAGYDAHYVTGYIKKRNGKGPHAWVEIKVKGKTYVYDPNFQKEYKKNGFAIRYGQKNTLSYIRGRVY